MVIILIIEITTRIREQIHNSYTKIHYKNLWFLSFLEWKNVIRTREQTDNSYNENYYKNW